MTITTTKPDSSQPRAEMAVDLLDNWFDPIETEVRARARDLIEDMIRGELDTVLARPRYGRSQIAGNEGAASVAGHRHGSRMRSLTGTFGPIEIAVPRARLNTPEGKTTEWKSQALRAYQRRTLAADALIASTYLAGTNTRRVRRALAALFGGAVGKDTVSRSWRKVKGDWDAWNTRSLAEEPIVRLILDGTVVRVRLDRKATCISLLVVIAVREDGQKVVLAIKSMGGESTEAWRTVLDDLIKRGLRRPEFLIVDGAPGLDKAIAAVWDGVPVQRCTVHTETFSRTRQSACMTSSLRIITT
jgi:putative transposase